MNRGSASRSYHQKRSVACSSKRRRPAAETPRPWVEGIHLSHVNESAHEVLIAQCVDSLLGLLPCCVFHNPTRVSRRSLRRFSVAGHSPASLQNPRTMSQSVNPTSNNQNKTRKTSHLYVLAPTFDIPFGSNSTSAKRTSPAAFLALAANHSGQRVAGSSHLAS